MQPPQEGLTFPLIFEWKKQGNMPYATNFDNLCIINGKVYISECQRHSILEYNPDADTWVDLPTPTKGHGMVSHNGKLTLVGGLAKKSTSRSSKIRVWDSDSKQWTEPYPPMTSGWAEVVCASYLHYLIIARFSGESVGHEVFEIMITDVEILDTRSGQWFEAPPMPCNRPLIQPVTIGESLFISSMVKTVAAPMYTSATWYPDHVLWRVSLPTLISHAVQGKDRDISIWERLPGVPYDLTTLFSIGNMLLAAGGECGSRLLGFLGSRSYKSSADIHLFNPHLNQWLKISELPEPRFSCACTLLPSGKLLVAGGYGDRKCPLPTVYTATIARS